MKSVLFIAFMAVIAILTSVDANASSRFEVGDGIYIVSYGDVTVIENDNTQQTVKIKVQQKSDNLYDIFCNNTFVKSVTKGALKVGIKTAITTYSGGTLTGVGNIVVDAAVEAVYESVCQYFE